MGVLKRLASRRHLEWLAPHGQDEQSYTSALQFQVLIPFTRFSLFEFLPSGCAGVANQTCAKDIALPQDALSTKLEVGRKQFPVRRAFRRRRFKKMPSKENDNFYTDETTIMAERRSHLRFPFTASVEAIEPKSGTRIHGRSTDLGLGGCYVDSLSPFAVGTVVKIRITKNDECFDAKAMVTFSQVGMGMGLSFVASEPQQSALFQRWVTELSGGGGEQGLKEDREARVSKSAGPHDALHEAQADVLNELVIALMRKGLLAEREGREMLRKLHPGASVADKLTAGR
jgi:hypothetical protein